MSSPAETGEDGALWLVQWEDTTNIAAWLTPDEVTDHARNGGWCCENVGYLVYQDDDCVVIAGRRAHDPERHVGLVERIPRRAVTAMTRLTGGQVIKRRRSIWSRSQSVAAYRARLARGERIPVWEKRPW